MAGWGWGQAGLARNPRYRSLGGALKATKPGRNPYAFTPYQPPPLPTGSYDPGLDAQAGAANRGYFYGSQDYETGQGRRNVDYGLQSGYAAQDHQAALDSLKFGLGRTQQDLATQAQRGGQDYMRNIQMLTRNYQRLGTSQLQQQNATGCPALRGGPAGAGQADRQRGVRPRPDRPGLRPFQGGQRAGGPARRPGRVHPDREREHPVRPPAGRPRPQLRTRLPGRVDDPGPRRLREHPVRAGCREGQAGAGRAGGVRRPGDARQRACRRERSAHPDDHEGQLHPDGRPVRQGAVPEAEELRWRRVEPELGGRRRRRSRRCCGSARRSRVWRSCSSPRWTPTGRGCRPPTRARRGRSARSTRPARRSPGPTRTRRPARRSSTAPSLTRRTGCRSPTRSRAPWRWSSWRAPRTRRRTAHGRSPTCRGSGSPRSRGSSSRPVRRTTRSSTT
jgi:hypothetical protein